MNMATNYKKIFEDTHTIVVIGASANKYRTSYHIASYLKENGFRIIPVNPKYDEVLGIECYDELNEIPDKYSVDIIDIFRNSDYSAEMVNQIINWSEEKEEKPIIWTQLDVSSEEAEKLAEEADYQYVKNECMMVKHEELS